MRLDPEKVLQKISCFKGELDRSISAKREFSELHSDILQFCRVIFSKRNEYAEIDGKYPMLPKIIKLANDSEGKLPNYNPEEYDAEIEPYLAKEINNVLNRAEKIFLMRKKLQSMRKPNIDKVLAEIKINLDEIKISLNKLHETSN